MGGISRGIDPLADKPERTIILQRRSSNPRYRLQPAALKRAMRYLGHYRKQAVLPYLFLMIATMAQLAVPRMVGDLIDAIVQDSFNWFVDIVAERRNLPRAEALPARAYALPDTSARAAAIAGTAPDGRVS